MRGLLLSTASLGGTSTTVLGGIRARRSKLKIGACPALHSFATWKDKNASVLRFPGSRTEAWKWLPFSAVAYTEGN